MATINVGGRTIERPNSFGDAASNAQVKTPQLRLPAPEVSKPLFGPHDPVYHGDGRYGAPANPGATNATAGATQGVGNTGPAMANNPGGAGGGGAGVSAEVAKRTGLRGALDTAKGVGGNALKSAASAPGVGVVSAAGQAFKEADNFGPGELSGLADAYGNSKLNGKEPSPENVDTITRVYEGMGRVGLSGAGAAAGFKTGLQAPGGPWVKGAAALGLGAAGAYFGPKVSDAAVGAGRAALEGDFDKALAIGTGQQAPVMTPPGAGSANAQAAAQPTLRQDPLRVQEARSNIADPGRTVVPAPVAKELRFGVASPTGTFADGYTDMGGGIAGKSNRRDGKTNDYTNIGADGKPVAMSTVDSRTPDQIANGNRLTAQAAAALRNPDGSKWSANDNAIMAANLRDGIDPYRGTSRGNAQAQGGMSPGMAGIAAAEQQLGVPLGKARRAQAVVDETAANNKRTNQTTLRGQDMDLQGRLLPKQMEMEMAQRMRQLNAQIYQQSGGDPRRAQELALSMGMDGEAFGKLADANQTRSDKSRQQTRDLLAPAAIVKDKDDNDVISPARQAQVEAAVRDAYPNYETLPPDKKAAATQRVLSMEKVRAAANDRKDTGLRKALGLDLPAFEMNTLPEFAGNAEEVGFVEGFTTLGLSRGDLKVPVKGGGTKYLSRDRFTEAEIETLKNNGASLRNGAN